MKTMRLQIQSSFATSTTLTAKTRSENAATMRQMRLPLWSGLALTIFLLLPLCTPAILRLPPTAPLIFIPSRPPLELQIAGQPSQIVTEAQLYQDESSAFVDYFYCKSGTRQLDDHADLNDRRRAWSLVPSCERANDSYQVNALAHDDTALLEQTWLAFTSSIGFSFDAHNLHAFAFDWRQSHLITARALVSFVEARNLTSFDIATENDASYIIDTATAFFPSFASKMRRRIAVSAPCEGMPFAWPATLLGETVTWRNILLGSPSFYETVAVTRAGYATSREDQPDYKLVYESAGQAVSITNYEGVVNVTARALLDNALRYPGDAYVTAMPLNSDLLSWSKDKFAYVARRISRLNNKFADDDDTAAEDDEPAAEKALHIVYGSLLNVATAAQLTIDVGQPANFARLWNSTLTGLSFDSGDGVYYSSSTSCRVSLPHATTRSGFPLVGRDDMLVNTKPLHLIEKHLGTVCVWDGWWRLTIEQFTQEDVVLSFDAKALSVTEETYTLVGRLDTGNVVRGSLVGSFGNATFAWEMAPNCSSFTGYWQYPWSEPYHWRGDLLFSNYSLTSTTPEKPTSAFIGASMVPWIITFSIAILLIATLAGGSIVIYRSRGYIFEPPGSRSEGSYQPTATISDQDDEEVNFDVDDDDSQSHRHREVIE